MIVMMLVIYDNADEDDYCDIDEDDDRGDDDKGDDDNDNRDDDDDNCHDDDDDVSLESIQSMEVVGVDQKEKRTKRHPAEMENGYSSGASSMQLEYYHLQYIIIISSLLLS